jgi:replication-associated recombination protein RarA
VSTLFEKYRPQAWPDVVAQDKVVAIIERLKIGGLGGRAFWITGKSGTGKSTIANLIAREIADEWSIERVTARDLGVSDMRELSRTLATYGMGTKSGRAVIVEEAHGLLKAVIEQFLTLLESLGSHVVVVFCTTIEGEERLFDDMIDAHPLLSRCVPLALSQRGLAAPFAARLKAAAEAEGLDGKPVEAYVRLVNDCGGNMRAAFSKIEAGVMLG